jgi:uncharacterized phiE125 gp8 family phage protein
MPWTETAAPAALAINLDELKNHLRLTSNDEDGLLAVYAKAAVQLFEAKTRRRLVSRPCRWEQPDFPAARDGLGIELPVAPVSAVAAVQYYATDGTLTTWSPGDYYLDTVSLLPRVTLAPNKTYPTVQTDRPNGVQVTFTAGYGASYAAVPEGVQWAVLLLAAHMFSNRLPVAAGSTADVPKTLQYAVDAYKIWGA